MAEKIAQHKHCVICRKVSSPKSDTCSTECEEKWQLELKKRKNMQLLMYLAIAFFIGTLLVSLFLGR